MTTEAPEKIITPHWFQEETSMTDAELKQVKGALECAMSEFEIMHKDGLLQWGENTRAWIYVARALDLFNGKEE